MTLKETGVLRRSFIVLAGGGVLLVAGFIITIAAAISIAENAEQNTFGRAIISLNPFGQESTSFDVSDMSQPFYFVASRMDENELIPPAVLVEGRVVDPNGETILTDADIVQGITMVEPTVAGTYSLHLTNMHLSEEVSLFITLTHGSIPTTGQETLTIAGWAVAGVLLMMASVVIIVVGAALFFREWRKSKKDPSIVT